MALTGVENPSAPPSTGEQTHDHEDRIDPQRDGAALRWSGPNHGVEVLSSTLRVRERRYECAYALQNKLDHHRNQLEEKLQQNLSAETEQRHQASGRVGEVDGSNQSMGHEGNDSEHSPTCKAPI